MRQEYWIHNIKKWYKMMTVRIIMSQGMGTCYSKMRWEGHYNDLSYPFLTTRHQPTHVRHMEQCVFLIGIFQYTRLHKWPIFKTGDENIWVPVAGALCILGDWKSTGKWCTVFGYKETESPYFINGTRQGISMLIRAHIVSREKSYIKAVHKAKRFYAMLIPAGGTMITHW